MRNKTPNTSERRTPRQNSTLNALARAIALAVCLLAAAAHDAVGQADNFDDGNDTGWTRYDRTGTATFSFPDGGYHILGEYTGSPPLILSTRSEVYTDFYAAVDLVAWDDNTITNARAALGLTFRAADVGRDTTRALVAYWTPAISGGGNRVFSIYYIENDAPVAPLAATFVTLETNCTYRMVVTGVGNFLEGRIYNRNDLTKPVAYIAGNLDALLPFFPSIPSSGKCGVFLFSRNNTTVSATCDNYYAASLAPTNVPAPGTPHPVPGAPQVVGRVPESNKNFHPAGAGLSFTATTLNTNVIDPSGIRLWLNGEEVSAALTIGGSPTNRAVSYSGLKSNTLYQARIVLTETGGKSSTNDFCFDTFSEAFITSSAVKMVEAEDYNHSGGQYQNDPPPSGYQRTPPNSLVNGNGVGYVDLPGTPDVDFFDRRTGPEAGYTAYRYFDAVGTFAGSLYYQTDVGMTTLTTNDTPLQKFEALDLPDYQIQHTEGGEWLNYTRDFTSGKYHVYLRLSSYSPMDVLFAEVTSDRTQPNQTTNTLGKFQVINTGHLSHYRYFPLVDDTGKPVVLNWSGQKTFRLTMSGPQQEFTKHALQLNYLMFVPAPTVPDAFVLIRPSRSGNVFSVSFAAQAGFTYTLQYKNTLADATWTDGASVGGDGAIKTLTDTSSQSARVYRVSAH